MTRVIEDKRCLHSAYFAIAQADVKRWVLDTAPADSRGKAREQPGLSWSIEDPRAWNGLDDVK
jgi:hypothetical protein